MRWPTVNGALLLPLHAGPPTRSAALPASQQGLASPVEGSRPKPPHRGRPHPRPVASTIAPPEEAPANPWQELRCLARGPCPPGWGSVPRLASKSASGFVQLEQREHAGGVAGAPGLVLCRLRVLGELDEPMPASVASVSWSRKVARSAFMGSVCFQAVASTVGKLLDAG